MVPKQWHALAQRGKPAQTPRPHPQIGGVGAAQTRLPSWLPAARSGAQPFLLAQVTLSGNANEHAQSCLFASTCGHGHCACMHARTLTRADAHPRLLPKSTPPRQTSGGALSPATRRCAGGVRRGGVSLVLAWRLKDLRYSGFVSLEAGRESDVSTLQMGKNARGKDLASIATATQSYERGARALVAVRIQHASNHIGEAERRSQVCELRRTLEVSGEN